tara:strand:+ start:613 stop:1008 length:396 start_codon:yes stop_codon:yes gene_type:complete
MNTINNMVEVTLKAADDFLKVRETLTRVGVASKKSDTLFQSCHILHKQGKYYITHFKELFALDGKPTDFTDDDKARRNTITNLLAEWGLVELVDAEKSAEPTAPLSQIKVIPHSQKSDWELVTKYNIGKKR